MCCQEQKMYTHVKWWAIEVRKWNYYDNVVLNNDPLLKISNGYNDKKFPFRLSIEYTDMYARYMSTMEYHTNSKNLQEMEVRVFLNFDLSCKLFVKWVLGV